MWWRYRIEECSRDSNNKLRWRVVESGTSEAWLRLADATGGRAYTPETADQLLEDVKYTGRGITSVEERDLWQSPLVLLLLVGLLSAEWGYRRAVGLS